MRSRRRFTDSAVIALRLKRLRDQQHMAQTLVLDDGTLIDFSQTIVLPAAQHAIVSTELDPSIRVLPHLDLRVDQLPVLRRVVQ